MDLFVTIFLAIIFSINLGNCDIQEYKFKSKGKDVVVIACAFNVDNLNKFKTKIKWNYFNKFENDNRITEQDVYGKSTMFSILEIKNYTKSNDKGRYACILETDGVDIAQRSIDVDESSFVLFELNIKTIAILSSIAICVLLAIIIGAVIYYFKCRRHRFMQVPTEIEMPQVHYNSK